VTQTDRDQLIGPLLRDVSRSFYLTLRVLPKALRPAISLGYLLARASDTIADTKVVPRDKRRAHLVLFRQQFERRHDTAETALIRADLAQHQSLPAEKLLLERLDDCFAMLASLPADDRARIGELLGVITRGQENDLVQFPGETERELAAFDTDPQLDDYTYAVAGCVGKFWTEMCVAHLRALRGWDRAEMTALGIRFGKALQLTNILRDIPKDLRIARCYVPRQRLAEAGLEPEDLLSPAAMARFRPVYDRHLDLALGHFDAAWRYTLAIPRSCGRLRLACLWPIFIGLKTLALLRRSDDVLDPDKRLMVAQGDVNRMLAGTVVFCRSNKALDAWFRKLRREAARKE
jgi:farnesyl-diphosphate farnesyltransferase